MSLNRVISNQTVVYPYTWVQLFSKYCVIVVSLAECPIKSEEWFTLIPLWAYSSSSEERHRSQNVNLVCIPDFAAEECCCYVCFLFLSQSWPHGVKKHIFRVAFFPLISLSITSLMECPKLNGIGNSRSCHTDISITKDNRV